MTRYRIRMAEFVDRSKSYVQGHGMTWDDVIVELQDGEIAFDMQHTSVPAPYFTESYPAVRVWIATEEPA